MTAKKAIVKTQEITESQPVIKGTQEIIEVAREVTEPTPDSSSMELSVLPGEERLERATKLLQQQAGLSLEAVKTMVSSEDIIGDVQALMARNAMMLYGVPLSGINLIKGKIFINQEGIRFKVHSDKREVLEWGVRENSIHMPTVDEPYFSCVAKLRWEGQEGPNDGYTQVGTEYFQPIKNEKNGVVIWHALDRAGKSWVPCNLGNKVMGKVTSAMRRAGLAATGIALPAWEDRGPSSDDDTVEGTFKVVQPEEKPAEPARDWTTQPPSTLADYVKLMTEKGIALPVMLTSVGMSMQEFMAALNENNAALWIKVAATLEPVKEA